MRHGVSIFATLTAVLLGTAYMGAPIQADTPPPMCPNFPPPRNPPPPPAPGPICPNFPYPPPPRPHPVMMSFGVTIPVPADAAQWPAIVAANPAATFQQLFVIAYAQYNLLPPAPTSVPDAADATIPTQ